MKPEQILKLLPIEAKWIALITVALGLAVLAFKWLQKRRAAKQAAGGQADVAATPKVAPPRIAPNKLSRIWQLFLKELPPVFRRSILNFQPMIVLGAAGSGKSRLIDQFTDWRRQSRQFLGSVTDDPDLQIYLGSRVLVLEVAPNILNETSSAARKALIKLWSPVLRGRTPIAIVAVDLHALQQASPDAARALADTIRGKLSLLSWITKRRTQVRVALTHLDRIEGYPEVAKFFDRQSVPATIELDAAALDTPHTLQDNLVAKFNDLDRLLGLALTTLSSTEYLKVVAFLREAPKYLPQLATFVNALCAPDPLSKRPELEKIYLTSPDHQTATNPFHTAYDTSIDRTRSPLFRHQLAATGIALAGIFYMLTGYLLQRERFNDSHDAVVRYSQSIPRGRENELRRRLNEVRKESAPDPWLALFPNFFGSAEAATQATLSDSIRRELLLNRLEESMVTPHRHQKSLYHLALLFATSENALGRMIDPSLETLTATSGEAMERDRDLRGRLTEWSTATGLDRELIRAYISSSPGFHEKVSLEGLTQADPPGPTNSLQPWVSFLRRLNELTAQRFINAEDYGELQANARVLLDALGVIRTYRHTPEILETLEMETGFDFRRTYYPALDQVEFPKVFEKKLNQAERLLQAIASPSSTQFAEEPPALLDDLCSELMVELEPPRDESTAGFILELGGETIALAERDWEERVRYSKSRELLLAFVRAAGERGGSIFFPEGPHPETLSMNPRNDGNSLFIGKASLDGKYTRAAFDKSVRPAVTQLAAILDRMELDPVERASVEGFIRQQVGAYADEYVKNIDDYYGSFRVKAGSAEALQVLIKQMRRPTSPFHELLNVMFVNTKLDVDEKDPLLGAIHEPMKKYQPLQNLAPDKDGKMPELEKYDDMLAQLDSMLSGGAAAEEKAAAPKAGEAKPAEAAPKAGAENTVPPGLAEVLSPAGRGALSILRLEPSAHRAIVAEWLDSVDLVQAELGKPFMAPIDALVAVGTNDIEKKVREVWAREILPSLSRAKVRFPFDPLEEEELSPKEMEEIFHPVTGKFHDLTRRFIDPVSNINEQPGRGRVLSGKDAYDLDGEMYALINKVEVLTRALWDEQGKAKPLKLEVTSVPFDASSDGKWFLTLVYLESGSATLVNFNQQPFPRAFELDWMKLSRARIGVELTSSDSGEKIYPTPLVARASHWSFLRLLSRGELQGTTWTWRIPYGKGKEPAVSVRFGIAPDPRTIFQIFPRNKFAARQESSIEP